MFAFGLPLSASEKRTMSQASKSEISSSEPETVFDAAESRNQWVMLRITSSSSAVLSRDLLVGEELEVGEEREFDKGL